MHNSFGVALGSHFESDEREEECQYAVIKFIPGMEIEFVRVYLFTFCIPTPAAAIHSPFTILSWEFLARDD